MPSVQCQTFTTDFGVESCTEFPLSAYFNFAYSEKYVLEKLFMNEAI